MLKHYSVDLQRNQHYDIQIKAGLLHELGEQLKAAHDGATFFVLSQQLILDFQGASLFSSLEAARLTYDVLTVPDGEQAKTVSVYADLLGNLLEKGVERSSVILAFGGGVVGDLAGFVASSCLRGLPFYQIPTTLLAQVDASIGGKTGINHAWGKNLIGAFYQPKAVWVDPSLLQTLDQRQCRSGLAEVIKYAVIWDEKLFDYLEKHVAVLAEFSYEKAPEHWDYLIARSCEIKAHVVQEDEQERGLRAILNYGHTAGHGIEAAFDYQGFLHGEAVALGMLVANRLAEQFAGFSKEASLRIERLLKSFGYALRFPVCDLDLLLQRMKRDKKREKSLHRFILPSRIGEVSMKSLSGDDDIMQALRSVMEDKK